MAHVVKMNPTLRALGQSVTLMQKLLGWTGLVVFGALALLVWWIAFTNPAKEARRILQQGITEPVEEVQRRIMEAQRKLHRAKD